MTADRLANKYKAERDEWRDKAMFQQGRADEAIALAGNLQAKIDRVLAKTEGLLAKYGVPREIQPGGQYGNTRTGSENPGLN